MKRLLSIICAVCLIITPVCATEISGFDSAETTVTGHVDSQYCVLIPESIVADGTEYYFQSSMMDLANGDYVNINISGLNDDSRLQMTGGDGNGTVHFQLTDGNYVGNGTTVATFYDGETTASTGLKAYLHAEKPGDYTGIVTFNIALNHD